MVLGTADRKDKGKRNMTKRLAILLFAFLGLAVSGCGAMRHAAAKQNYINHQMQEYKYEKPLAEVWPEARTILFTNNYQVRDTGEANVKTLETEWAYDDQGNSSRYLVQGVEMDEGASCKVLFTRQSRNAKSRNTDSTRDFSMEWNLVRATDPGRAAQIEQEADSQGEQARNG